MARASVFILLAAVTIFGQGVRLLSPSAFPELPAGVASELKRRGCSIPQASGDFPRHNAIRGHFARPHQFDWAVLCSTRGSSSILVFWNGSAANVSSIEPQADHIRMQSNAAGKMVYSRKIEPVGKDYIGEHYRAYGGPEPPPIDHQGINDIFVGKASVVLYLYQGKWLHLTGAD